MTRPRDLNENPGYDADSDVGFDDEGYVLAPGDDADDSVKKHPGGGESVVGVNHMSTYNYDETVVQQGVQNLPVHQDGYVNVLCGADGTTFNLGDTVAVSSAEAGTVVPDGHTDDSGDNVGTVVEPTTADKWDYVIIKLTEV